MTSNNRDWNIAFQAAEAALRDAEREIYNGTRVAGETGFVAGCSSTSSPRGAGLCLPNLCTDTSASGDCTPIWIDLANKQNDAGWKTGSGTSKSIAYGEKTGAASLNITGSETVAALPRYIIEVLTVKSANSETYEFGEASQYQIYRITAVGFGKNTSTRVMLQGTYRPN